MSQKIGKFRKRLSILSKVQVFFSMGGGMHGWQKVDTLCFIRVLHPDWNSLVFHPSIIIIIILFCCSCTASFYPVQNSVQSGSLQSLAKLYLMPLFWIQSSSHGIQNNFICRSWLQEWHKQIKIHNNNNWS